MSLLDLPKPPAAKPEPAPAPAPTYTGRGVRFPDVVVARAKAAMMLGLSRETVARVLRCSGESVDNWKFGRVKTYVEPDPVALERIGRALKKLQAAKAACDEEIVRALRGEP